MKLILAICFSMALLFSSLTYAGEPVLDIPTPEVMVQELNDDMFLKQMGFVFEQDGLMLVFHTGKSMAEINKEWKRFGKLTMMVSNNWKIVTGCGIVVGLDNEGTIAFVTDNDGAFHMAETPRGCDKQKNTKKFI